MKSAPGPPMTLGAAAAAQVRLIVWCKGCQRQVEPDPAEMADRYGAEISVPDWRDRLVCPKCCCHEIDMVGTGTERRYSSPHQVTMTATTTGPALVTGSSANIR